MKAEFIFCDENDREINRRTGQFGVEPDLSAITEVGGFRYQIVGHEVRLEEPQGVVVTLRRCGVASNA